MGGRGGVHYPRLFRNKVRYREWWPTVFRRCASCCYSARASSSSFWGAITYVDRRRLYNLSGRNTELLGEKKKKRLLESIWVAPETASSLFVLVYLRKWKKIDAQRLSRLWIGHEQAAVHRSSSSGRNEPPSAIVLIVAALIGHVLTVRRKFRQLCRWCSASFSFFSIIISCVTQSTKFFHLVDSFCSTT